MHKILKISLLQKMKFVGYHSLAHITISVISCNQCKRATPALVMLHDFFLKTEAGISVSHGARDYVCLTLNINDETLVPNLISTPQENKSEWEVWVRKAADYCRIPRSFTE